MCAPALGRNAAALLAGAVLAACHARPPVSPAQDVASACIVADDAVQPELTLGLTHALEPARPPVPLTPSERLVFRQVYETLVRVDCTGRVHPGLAASWSTGEQNEIWHFRLRTDARFHDGAPVTAHDVVASWAASEDSRARAPVRFAEVTAVGERELRVRLQTALAQPHVFAQAELAVARAGPGRWPLGSGAFRWDTMAGADRLVSDDGRVLTLHNLQRADPRAALDSGIDALITSHPAVLAYGSSLPSYTLTPLSWSRTLVFVTRRSDTGGDEPHVLPDVMPYGGSESDRPELRPAEGPFWWRDSTCAGVQADTGPRMGEGRTIVYARNDASARAVAERLAALAWPPSRTPAPLRALLPADYARGGAPTAQGLDERALLATLRNGRALAAVLSLPRAAPGLCPAAGLDAAAAFTLGLHITPVADVREYLVHRAGIGRVTVDGDGTPRFHAGSR